MYDSSWVEGLLVLLALQAILSGSNTGSTTGAWTTELVACTGVAAVASRLLCSRSAACNCCNVNGLSSGPHDTALALGGVPPWRAELIRVPTRRGQRQVRVEHGVLEHHGIVERLVHDTLPELAV